MASETADGVALPRVAVLYELGSASPMQVARASMGACSVVFVCVSESRAIDETLPTLYEIAGVLDLRAQSNDQAVNVMRTQDLAGVITFSEALLPVLAMLVDELDLPGQPPDVALRLYDKGEQRARLASMPNHVRHQVVSSTQAYRAAVEQMGFPHVLKPRVGTASRGVAVIHELDEGLTHLARQPSTALLVEESLDADLSVAGQEWGPYVSVETITLKGVRHHVLIQGKTKLQPGSMRETGSFAPCTVDETHSQRIVAVADEALTALGFESGWSHTEVMLTTAGPRIIEVNGRLGGAVAEVLEMIGQVDAIRLALWAALEDQDRISAATEGISPTLPGGDVAYQLLLQPPLDLASISSVEGLQRIRSLPGVLSVQPTRALHAPDLESLVTIDHVAKVNGRVSRHEDLQRIITMVNNSIKIRP